MRTTSVLSFVIACTFWGCAGGPSEEEWNANSGDQLVVSIANNPLTAGTYNAKKASRLAQRESDGSSDPEAIHQQIVLKRLAGSGEGSAGKDLRRLAEHLIGANLNAKIPGAILIEYALLAYQQREFGLVFGLLDLLVDDHSADVKSAAFNLRGLLAWDAGDVAEANQYFEKGLDIQPKNPALLINSGYLNLQFGAFQKADDLLRNVEGDWFAKAGRIVALRFLGKTDEALALCAALLPQRGRNKAIVFNCGLAMAQNGKKEEGVKLMKQALDLAGPKDWDSKIKSVLQTDG